MAEKLGRGDFFGSPLQQRRVGDLVLLDSLHAPGSRLPRHSHEHAYFCLNHGGTYTEQYGRRRRVCQPGMLVFHPPGESHSEAHGDVPVASLNVELGGPWLQRFVDLCRPLDQPAEFRRDEVAAAGFHILREFRMSDPDSGLAIEALTWEVLAESSGREPHASDKSGPPWLREARDLLDARLHEPLTLRAVAKEAGVHPVHLASMFRRFHGCSVGEYRRRRRFQCARRKLADTDLPLGQIALDAGFADQSHLTRTFKRFTGMTPGQYRTFLGFKTR